jgi:hypothetical protein
LYRAGKQVLSACVPNGPIQFAAQIFLWRNYCERKTITPQTANQKKEAKKRINSTHTHTHTHTKIKGSQLRVREINFVHEGSVACNAIMASSSISLPGKTKQKNKLKEWFVKRMVVYPHMPSLNSPVKSNTVFCVYFSNRAAKFLAPFEGLFLRG